ncbi:hypothetical protein HanXRQr2_Chr10g0422261 [Helianthus annuus]|uniref:Uncharacterized protein n=1 Tax=Helianthus annuus TaxID=4232 RepID=A0A9K3N3D2_HELAN|nr:hypothetical protein HanXRQr2_Chr10g0422261 [Helianthus annuus]KAJ0892400.1 hypothetical protein HanPSC8_Chr09g0365411 [Helianthus annuus]
MITKMKLVHLVRANILPWFGAILINYQLDPGEFRRPVVRVVEKCLVPIREHLI